LIEGDELSSGITKCSGLTTNCDDEILGKGDGLIGIAGFGMPGGDDFNSFDIAGSPTNPLYRLVSLEKSSEHISAMLFFSLSSFTVIVLLKSSLSLKKSDISANSLPLLSRI
jgi:hypothetical protein